VSEQPPQDTHARPWRPVTDGQRDSRSVGHGSYSSMRGFSSVYAMSTARLART